VELRLAVLWRDLGSGVSGFGQTGAHSFGGRLR
jgi:hypothetical protein